MFIKEQPGAVQAIRLQEFVAGSGFTDIEIDAERLAVVLEAKRGWALPTLAQLEYYLPRLKKTEIGRVVVVSECTPQFAMTRLPKTVGDVPLVYLSWRRLVTLAETCGPKTNAEKRILLELTSYLRSLMTMQNHISNLVYVASLGTAVTEWSKPFTPVQIVVEKGRYFHPIGNRYPKEPPNYVAFRWNGQLQQIRHVEDYVISTDLHEQFAEMRSKTRDRHFVYTLGPPIVPPKTVKTGNLFRGARVWAAIDLLFTCDSISEARDRTNARLAAVGRAPDTE